MASLSTRVCVQLGSEESSVMLILMSALRHRVITTPHATTPSTPLCSYQTLIGLKLTWLYAPNCKGRLHCCKLMKAFSYFRAMLRYIRARYCHEKSSVRPSLRLSVSNVEVSLLHTFE